MPAAVAAYSVVGERLQGTLEPVLSTPVRRDELLLGKALAAFVPSVAVAYAVFALFLVLVELFARAAVASALIRGPELLAQVVFTPLLATWSIWVGIAVSARSSDPRIAGQLALLLSLPTVAVTSLIAFNLIPATLGTAIVVGAALLILCSPRLAIRVSPVRQRTTHHHYQVIDSAIESAAARRWKTPPALLRNERRRPPGTGNGEKRWCPALRSVPQGFAERCQGVVP